MLNAGQPLDAETGAKPHHHIKLSERSETAKATTARSAFVQSLFQNRVFSRVYTKEDSRIGLGVNLDREARLIFWFGNADDDDLAAELLSRDDWGPEQEDYGYWSKNDLARIEAGCVPLKRLQAAAVGALSTITG